MSPVVYTRRKKVRRLSVFILEQQQYCLSDPSSLRICLLYHVSPVERKGIMKSDECVCCFPCRFTPGAVKYARLIKSMLT